MYHSTNAAEKSASRIWGGCKCGGKQRKQNPAKCKSITPSTPVEKPDLAIYSQDEALAKGQIPSWDSPDIVTNNWSPFRLMPEARVKIRNLSPSVPAINAIVHYFISPFGIGTRKELKGSKVVNVPPNAELELYFPLDQSTLNGDPRVGVHFLIEHPFDENRLNNSGSQVHDGGYTSESGRNFDVQIPVFNDSAFAQEILFSVMPTDLVTALSIASHNFMPFEQIILTLNVQIPGFLVGAPGADINRAVTVTGRLASGAVVGGVTRLIRIDN